MPFLNSFIDRGRELYDRGREISAELSAGLKADATVQIEGRSLVIGRQIAEGGFAFVNIARDTTTGEQFAVKRIRVQDREAAANARAEQQLLSSLPPHPNVVRLVGHRVRPFERGDEYLLVFEFCARGSLINFVIPLSTGSLPPVISRVKLLKAFFDVCKAVAHLHSQRPPIAHRDLKLENVLIDAAGTCKLCDFGSATTKVFDCATATQKQRVDQEDHISRTTTQMNRAPEMIDLHRRKLINQAVDIWALGCLVFTLAFQRHPFDAASTLASLNGRYYFPNRAVHRQLLEPILADLLNVEPEARPDIFDVTQRVALMYGEAQAGAGGSPDDFEALMSQQMAEGSADDRPTEPLTLRTASMVDSTASASAAGDDVDVGVDAVSAGAPLLPKSPEPEPDLLGTSAPAVYTANSKVIDLLAATDLMADSAAGPARGADPAACAGWQADFVGFGGSIGAEATQERQVPTAEVDLMAVAAPSEVPTPWGEFESSAAATAGLDETSNQEMLRELLDDAGAAPVAVDSGGGATVSDAPGTGASAASALQASFSHQAEAAGGAPIAVDADSGGLRSAAIDPADCATLDAAPAAAASSLFEDHSASIPDSARPSQASPAQAVLPEATANAQSASAPAPSLDPPSAHAPGQVVRVVGLKARPEINGSDATILSWDAARQRYNVSLSESGAVLALRAANVEAARSSAGPLEDDWLAYANGPPHQPEPQPSQPTSESLWDVLSGDTVSGGAQRSDAASAAESTRAASEAAVEQAALAPDASASAAGGSREANASEAAASAEEKDDSRASGLQPSHASFWDSFAGTATGASPGSSTSTAAAGTSGSCASQPNGGGSRASCTADNVPAVASESGMPRVSENSVAQGTCADALEPRPPATRLKDALLQLKECLDEGLLTQAEYDAEKKAVLLAIRSPI